MLDYATASDATPSRMGPDDVIHYWMSSPDGQAEMHVASVHASAPDVDHDAAIAAGLAEGEGQGCDWSDWTLSTGTAP